MTESKGYRVVYGETIPAWERILPTLGEAEAFAKEQKTVGDMIFSIAEVLPDQPPQSLAAAIEADAVETFCATWKP